MMSWTCLGVSISSVVQGFTASPEFRKNWGSRLCMQGLSRPVVKEMILGSSKGDGCFVGRRNLKKERKLEDGTKMEQKLWIHNMEQHGPMVQFYPVFKCPGPAGLWHPVVSSATVSWQIDGEPQWQWKFTTNKTPVVMFKDDTCGQNDLLEHQTRRSQPEIRRMG